MLTKLKLLWLLLLAPFFGTTSFAQCAKFEPPDGNALLIIGQDLGSVGGSSYYNNGYVENVGGPVPGGITTYTDFPYLQGLTSVANYGAGDICAQSVTGNTTYQNSVLVIGLYLVNELNAIKNGQRDALIQQLGSWIKNSNRPVFLRIGYEYDGPWNSYNPADYKIAFKRIVDKFRASSVDNCAFVWQSCGYGSDTSTLKQWYPGDDYVDWMAYSHFMYTNNGTPEMALARAHHKPLMIAEATPQGDIINSNYSWNRWFGPLFQHIQNNQDVIKALAYINANWDGQSMWAGQGWGDSRIQNSSTIKAKWLAEINSSFWLKSSSTLFASLNCSTTGTEKIKPEISLSVYPNPSKGEITINHLLTIKEIIVTNLNGETIFREFYSNGNSIKIDLKNQIAAGVYILNIRDEISSTQQKIVICE
ncbi:MAG: T9SS type A sorting domain-containing protein [Flavobacteriales bacterium]